MTSGPSLVAFNLRGIHDVAERATTVRRKSWLIASLGSALGGYANLGSDAKALVERAAEMIALAECARRRLRISGATTSDLRSLERLEGLSRSATRRLDLPGREAC
jgi:hypothetical protein